MMGSRKRQAGMATDRKQRLREQGEDMVLEWTEEVPVDDMTVLVVGVWGL